VAEPLKDNDLELEGHKLVAVNAGRTDTAHSTCLHVPSIGLIVGGDAVYNGIHPYLGETDTQSRLEWISTLDKLEALKPKAVVAGHKVPENDDDPRIRFHGVPGIWSDEQIGGWKAVTRAVKEAGGRIFIQIWHVGRVSDPVFH
jgi:glyoxylase-like metal-dependent hydrolase (beta-lactamase superfamily II)